MYTVSLDITPLREFCLKTKEFLQNYKELSRVSEFHDVWVNSSVAIKIVMKKEEYEEEVKTQRLLSKKDIFPPIITTYETEYSAKTLISHGRFDDSDGEYIIVMPYTGKTIKALFYTPKDIDEMCVNSPLAESVPMEIREKIDKLVHKTKKAGYYMDDFHADNITIDDDGRVWLIDCGCVYPIKE